MSTFAEEKRIAEKWAKMVKSGQAKITRASNSLNIESGSDAIAIPLFPSSTVRSTTLINR